MVIVKSTSNIMYQCKVFYIGSGPPRSDMRGVEALQDPLRDRYRGNVSEVEGYDVTITVTPNEVNIKYTNDAEEELNLPIRTLSICAAVRCVESASDPTSMKFIPVHSVITAVEPDSDHPALFATVMRLTESDELLCHAFICNSTRDALHLVNATQTAHTAFTKGYNETRAMKFFVDRSTEFDRTLRMTQTKGDTRKIYMYHEDYDTRQYNPETKTYVTTIDNTGPRRINTVTRSYNDTNVTLEGNTYYVKAGEMHVDTPPPAQPAETVVVKASAEQIRAPTPPPLPQQTLIVDKPVIRQQAPLKIPPPQIIEREVMIEPPPLPKIEPQKIVVDKPVFPEIKWPEPPEPQIIENKVYITPPSPPVQHPQKVIVDCPVLKPWPKPPTPPPPEITENKIYIDPPAWPEQIPQKIVVDRPVFKQMPAPPPCPPPIIEERKVMIDLPEYPPQEPHKIVVEKPCFNLPKAAPPPPPPIIETKDIPVELPPYPPQEPQRIVVERPVFTEPIPPECPKPIIIEKPVEVELPKYPPQEPQRIIVEKVVMRPPGPPPPLPPPIVIEKKVYVDCPPWPPVEPQTIVVEKPIFRTRPPPQIPKPRIIEKPVYIDAPVAPPPVPQTVIVEKPVVRSTTYGMSETRRYPSAYNYHYQYKPSNIRGSYVVRTSPPPQRGLRRYAWSDTGEDRYRSGWDYNAETGGYRIFGQPRDFRSKPFMNERGFSRRINEELRYTRPSSHTGGFNSYGGAYRMNEKRGSFSS